MMLQNINFFIKKFLVLSSKKGTYFIIHKWGSLKCDKAYFTKYKVFNYILIISINFNI